MDKKEYIERAAAMESIIGLTIVDPAVAQYANAVYYNLQNLPAAEVVGVRHGRWIWNSHHCKWECSECGGMEGECESPVCKWCGARMDKEDENEVS